MQPTKLIVLAVVTLVLVMPAAPGITAQAQPNFSGTWKFAKQDPPPRRGRGQGAANDGEDRGSTRALEVAPVTLKITQNGNDMTFESTMSDGWVRTLQFKLDFTYTVNPLPPGGDGGEPRLNGPTKTRGRWMGDRLFLHLTQGLGQRRDILTISGAVLSIQRDFETPGAAGTTYLTFNKVS
jgi:hypothetical protein